MGTARVPPGLRSSAHVHTNCESALYVVAGRGKFLTGQHLERSLEVAEGDFIYVPPGAPHVVVNDHKEDLLLVVARNTQEEQVTEYDPEVGATVDNRRGASLDDRPGTRLAEPLLLDRCKTCRVPIRGSLAVFSVCGGSGHTGRILNSATVVRLAYKAPRTELSPPCLPIFENPRP